VKAREPRGEVFGKAIRKEGTKVLIQLFHPGRELLGRPEGVAQASFAPSFSPSERFRTAPRPMSLAMVEAGQEIDPNLRVMQAMTMAQHLATSRLPSQIGAFLLAAFAVLGMALTAIGVYGTVRYTVAMRTREVGIRMALGADAAGVARLLASRGLRLVLIGGVIGVAASLLTARFLATLLFGVGSFDPVALTGAPIVGCTAPPCATPPTYAPAPAATRCSAGRGPRGTLRGARGPAPPS